MGLPWLIGCNNHGMGWLEKERKRPFLFFPEFGMEMENPSKIRLKQGFFYIFFQKGEIFFCEKGLDM